MCVSLCACQYLRVSICVSVSMCQYLRVCHRQRVTDSASMLLHSPRFYHTSSVCMPLTLHACQSFCPSHSVCVWQSSCFMPDHTFVWRPVFMSVALFTSVKCCLCMSLPVYIIPVLWRHPTVKLISSAANNFFWPVQCLKYGNHIACPTPSSEFIARLLDRSPILIIAMPHVSP